MCVCCWEGGADGLRLLGRTPARQRPGSAPHDVDDQGLDLFKAFLEVVMIGMGMIRSQRMRIITIRVRPVLVKGSFTRMIIMITTGVFKIEVGSGQSIGDGHSFEECSFRHIHSFQTR